MSNPILLYDGVCGLCDRLTQFLLKRDRHDRLLFASLQSDFAAAILNRHRKDTHDLDTVYVVKDYEQPTEVLLARSDAILYVLKQVGGVWSLTGVAKVLPRRLRDRLHDSPYGQHPRLRVARHPSPPTGNAAVSGAHSET